jgi:hypothetical protein
VAGKIAVRYGIDEKTFQQQIPRELNYREWIEAIDAPLLLM